MTWLLLVAGIALLYAGGEGLVRGASGLAAAWGMPPLVIGLTVVAFGTSAPELAATLAAALDGAPELAFGNVVGSNLSNLGLVLGIAALLHPLRIEGLFLLREMPFLLASSIVILPMVYDGWIGRVDALLLSAGLAVFLFVLLRPLLGRASAGRRAEGGVPADEITEAARGGTLRNLVLTVAGIALLVLGAEALVTGAVALARTFGVSERLIGLTLVAIGTSLPELASTIVASLRREGDLLLGNLVGSNVFNLLFIVGATALVRPLEIVPSHDLWVDLAVMLAVSALLWVLLAGGRRLGPRKGVLLLVSYLAWLAFVVAFGG